MFRHEIYTIRSHTHTKARHASTKQAKGYRLLLAFCFFRFVSFISLSDFGYHFIYAHILVFIDPNIRLVSTQSTATHSNAYVVRPNNAVFMAFVRHESTTKNQQLCLYDKI